MGNETFCAAYCQHINISQEKRRLPLARRNSAPLIIIDNVDSTYSPTVQNQIVLFRCLTHPFLLNFHLEHRHSICGPSSFQFYFGNIRESVESLTASDKRQILLSFTGLVEKAAELDIQIQFRQDRLFRVLPSNKIKYMCRFREVKFKLREDILTERLIRKAKQLIYCKMEMQQPAKRCVPEDPDCEQEGDTSCWSVKYIPAA